MEKQWKYIVYETTNLINNKIYIGLHKTEDPNVFDGYIGNGIYITQPYTYQYAKTAFQYAVKKYGPSNFKRKTLAIFNTLEEASTLEAELVNEKFLERNDVYNMVLGGINGYFKSKEIEVHQYDSKGNYMCTYKSFAEAAFQLGCDYTLISYAVRKKAKAKNSYWNTDKVDKIDLSKYNKGDNHQIPIYIYLKTGEFYKEFKNQTQAAKYLNVSTVAIKSSRILGTCIKNEYYASSIEADGYDKARKTYIENRAVYKYSKEGKFIKGYSSQKEAELENPNVNITKSIRLKKSDELGNIWGLEELENYNVPKKRNQKRKVGKYDLQGNLVQIYNSATQAEKENGTSVWKVLNGTNRTHKQHIYKYLS